MSSTIPTSYAKQPSCIQYRLDSEVGARANALIRNWIIPAWDANPMMTEMFRLRDRQPSYENQIDWAGEFVGKHLNSAVALDRIADIPELENMISELLYEMELCQAENGYLGPYPENKQLLEHWDLWAHTHIIYGLLAAYDRFGTERPLNIARKIGDLVCSIYLNGNRQLRQAGWSEMNMAIGHAMAMLYERDPQQRYLDMAKEAVSEFEAPDAGDYYNQGVIGTEFYKISKPRWESLHCIQVFTELYRITGDENYKKVLLHYWSSIKKTDVHNNGSFSTEEGAIGNPYKLGAIETCCTVAWMALSVDALALSHDPLIADALEISTWNAALAFSHPSGRWVTYNTPMNGQRTSAAHSIVFQSRPGTPELNCCSVNGPRGIGMVADWAIMTNEESESDALYVNYYGPADMHFKDTRGNQWQITNVTEYPAEGSMEITVNPEKPTETTIYFRIPEWSRNTKVKLIAGGETVELKAIPGSYLPVKRIWRKRDRLKLDLDMNLYYLRGDEYVDGRTSVYRGPLLLAWDQSRNENDFDKFPVLDARNLKLNRIGANDGLSRIDVRFKPIVLFEAEGVVSNGEKVSVRLCDFASAGVSGSMYYSWLPVTDSGPMPVASEPYKKEQTKHKPFFPTELRGPIRSNNLSW